MSSLYAHLRTLTRNLSSLCFMAHELELLINVVFNIRNG